MANSSNTLWIVNCVKWKINKNGTSDVGNCSSRAYRSEKYARNRYNSIVDSLKTGGYSISELDVPAEEDYEGIRARYSKTINGEKIAQHAVVYIDRNPVWNKTT